MENIEFLKNYCQREIEVLSNLDLNAIDAVMNLLDKVRENGGKIFICGNGGSAATASHFCCDYNKGVNEYYTLPFVFECLNDNMATVMAIANDIGYEEVFRHQLKTKMMPGDAVIGISGSGNSKNVINAIEYAKENGGVTVAITGYDGGKLKPLADYSIHVPVNDMQIVEDIHIVLDHMTMAAFVHKWYQA